MRDEINARIDTQETHRGRFGEPCLFEFITALRRSRAGAIDVRLFAFAALPQPLRKVGESLRKRERLVGQATLLAREHETVISVNGGEHEIAARDLRAGVRGRQERATAAERSA